MKFDLQEDNDSVRFTINLSESHPIETPLEAPSFFFRIRRSKKLKALKIFYSIHNKPKKPKDQHPCDLSHPSGFILIQGTSEFSGSDEYQKALQYLAILVGFAFNLGFRDFEGVIEQPYAKEPDTPRSAEDFLDLFWKL